MNPGGWSAFGAPNQMVGCTQTLDEGDAVVYPEDMVAEFPAHWSIADCQASLATSGLTIPWFGLEVPSAFLPATLGRALDENLPHFLEFQHGSWRDWVVGMHVVLADGTRAKVGSRAVKNVAGYDAQKLFIGAMGTLGTIARVTLRVSPVRSLQPAEAALDDAIPGLIHRCLASDFDRLHSAYGDRLLASDRRTWTIWADGPEPAIRAAGDWVRVRGVALSPQELRPEEFTLLQRAKAVFDPARSCNPGALGIF